MQSTEDRRRLARQYDDAGTGPLPAVLRCLAGIATLFVVAAGPWVILSADTAGSGASAAPTAAAAVSSATAESRRVYEERRRRAESRPDGTKAALAR